MALNAAQNTFNVAVDTFIAAWETYVDTLSTGDEIILVPVCRGSGGTTTFNPTRESTVAASTNADPAGSPYKLYLKKGTATSWPIAYNTPPGAFQFLFHKLTNTAGDLTS